MLLCSAGRTKHSTEYAFLFISRHSSLRHYLQAMNIFFSVPITFFSSQATHPDARPSGPALLNMNHYSNKKSAAESMLDVALLMANASQLKAVLDQGPNFSFYAPTLTLIGTSLCLQVTVGVLLIFIGKKMNTAWAPQRLLCFLYVSQPSSIILFTLPLSKIAAYFFPRFALNRMPRHQTTPEKQPITYQTFAVTMATRSEFTRF